MSNYDLVKKFLDSDEYPSVCPYLKGQGSSYYCLTGGKSSECPKEVVSGWFYACDDSVSKSRYNRMFNEKVKK